MDPAPAAGAELPAAAVAAPTELYARVDALLWGPWTMAFLAGVAVYFTIRSGFFQLLLSGRYRDSGDIEAEYAAVTRAAFLDKRRWI